MGNDRKDHIIFCIKQVFLCRATPAGEKCVMGRYLNMKKEDQKKNIPVFGKIWFFAYLFAAGHILYAGQVNYNTSPVGTEIEIKTAIENPLIYYGTLIFCILNVAIGFYLGFIKKFDT